MGDDLDNEGINSNEFKAKLNAYKGENVIIKNVFVKVVNEEGVPIKDVNVDVSGITNITNSKGVALLKSVHANENFIATNISKNGYISITKTIAPTETEFQIINIVLLKPDHIKTIFSNSSASITLDSGAQVVLPGSFELAGGIPYSGNVKIEVKHLSPNDESTYSNMPGALLAQDKSGNIKLLETFGMVAVKLFASNGEALNISKENKATIKYPIAASQIGNAPSTIPLWYFDEDKSIWIEEGSANKVGPNYVAYVSHFSWWNIDFPIDLVNFCLSVSNTDNNILPNQLVKIIRKSTNQVIFNGYTNNNGKLCGAIPKNEKVTIKVLKKNTSCNLIETLFESDFGGYANQENDISINVNESSDSKNYTISGTVGNCNNTGAIDMHLELSLSNKTQYFFPNSDGSFSYNIMACKGEPMTLRAYDSKNELTNEAISLVFVDNIVNVGLIKTCENYSEKTYIGNLLFRSQEQMDAFTALGYTKIVGNLIINGDNLSSLKGFSDLISIEGSLTISPSTYSPLTSLSGFENLTSITENLTISGNFDDLKGLGSLSFVGETFNINRGIKSLSGLENLTVVGDLKIENTFNLKNLRGLENLKTLNKSKFLGKLLIKSNRDLESLEGLENLTYINWYLIIESNPLLLNFSGLSNLKIVNEGISIYDNASLTSLNGLNNITNIGTTDSYYNKRGGLYIKNNPLLNDLTNLNILTYLGGGLEIENNDALTNLNGLNNLTHIILNLDIVDNDNLQNFVGLSGITYLNGEVLIDNNLNLINFKGFENVTAFNNLVTIKNNGALKNFEGLEKTSIIKNDFSIDQNQTLENFSGLNSLKLVDGKMSILNNPSIINLDGLNNLEIINDEFNIQNNDSLLSLDGLSKLNTIYNLLAIRNNDGLLSLNGLETLREIKVPVYHGKFFVTGNSSLTDFCALLNNFTKDITYLTTEYYVSNNGYNPSPKFFSGEEPCKL